MPATEVTVVGPAEQLASMGKEAMAAERARQLAFVEAITGGFSDSGMRVLTETDAGAGPLPPGTRLLRLDAKEMPTVTDARGGVVAGCIVFGSITGGLGYLACTGARNRITQSALFEARLYDVSGAKTTRIENGGELVRVVDTSGLRPLYHGTHEVTVESGHHIMSAPKGPEAVEFAEEQGTRLGEVAYEDIAEPISNALRGLSATEVAAQPVPATTLVQTSGGEVPSSADDKNAPEVSPASPDAGAAEQP